MTLLDVVRSWFHHRVVPPLVPRPSIELAHAVGDRRRACKAHADLVASIVADPSDPDVFGVMVQDMRGKKSRRAAT